MLFPLVTSNKRVIFFRRASALAEYQEDVGKKATLKILSLEAVNSKLQSQVDATQSKVSAMEEVNFAD